MNLDDLIRIARSATTKEDFQGLITTALRRGIFPGDGEGHDIQYRAYAIATSDGEEDWALKNRPYSGAGHAKNSMRQHGAGKYRLKKNVVFEVCVEETIWSVSGQRRNRRQTITQVKG